MNVFKGKKMLFLTSFPRGRLENVEILGQHKGNASLFYITREKGGSDTTDLDFLYEIPNSIRKSESSQTQVEDIEFGPI